MAIPSFDELHNLYMNLKGEENIADKFAKIKSHPGFQNSPAFMGDYQDSDITSRNTLKIDKSHEQLRKLMTKMGIEAGSENGSNLSDSRYLRGWLKSGADDEQPFKIRTSDHPDYHPGIAGGTDIYNWAGKYPIEQGGVLTALSGNEPPAYFKRKYNAARDLELEKQQKQSKWDNLESKARRYAADFPKDTYHPNLLGLTRALLEENADAFKKGDLSFLSPHFNSNQNGYPLAVERLSGDYSYKKKNASAMIARQAEDILRGIPELMELLGIK